jgi:hypothetical protein
MDKGCSSQGKIEVKLTSNHSALSIRKLLENPLFLEGFQVISYPVTNRMDFKIQAVKHGFLFEQENGYEIFTYNNFRVMKINFDGRWVQINPDLPEELELVAQTLTEMIPDNFSFYVGNKSFKKEWLKNHFKFKDN